jgi:pyrroline-5-carboxylate reductase
MQKPERERSSDVIQRPGVLNDAVIAFIGAGAMGEAMIGGLLNSHLVAPGAIVASDPRDGRAQELRARYGVQAAEENREAVREARIVILSVKPQVLRAIFRDLRGAIHPDALVLSIVAGARVESITQGLRHRAVVRTMPNTPAQVGEGMTVWTATPEVTPLQRQQARAIVQALGKELFVAEEVFLDMATAISGTGPAYVFLLMEALIDAAVHLGFSRDDARTLVLQTVRGTAIFAEQSSSHPAEMRNLVTSPGGTSAHALYQLEKGGFRTVLSKAVWAAYQRSVALAALTSAVRPFEDEDTTDADADS